MYIYIYIYIIYYYIITLYGPHVRTEGLTDGWPGVREPTVPNSVSRFTIYIYICIYIYIYIIKQYDITIS